VLTEELRAEIQREVESRILELLREGVKLRESLEGPPVQVKGVLNYSAQIATVFSEAHFSTIAQKLLKPDTDELTKAGVPPSVERQEVNCDTAAAFRPELGTPREPPLKPLVRLAARAVEVLGNSDKALRWLNTPIRSLGDQTPVSLLDNPEGIVRVEDALGRIEHGIW
jgi:putative toxin-antitoxin system antitoxin component (TIGR02293 family)